MLYLPTVHLREGRPVRRGGFWTADAAFRGGLGDVVQFFREQSGHTVFHVVVEDDPLAAATRAAVAEAYARGATELLLESAAVVDTATCEALAELAVTPVATAALAGDPRLTAAWRAAQPRPVFHATAAESDELADELTALLPAGVPPLLYRPADAAVAADVFFRLREVLPDGLGFVAAAPPVTPDEDSIRAQMAYSRTIYRVGLPAIAVDAEWIIDYHLT